MTRLIPVRLIPPGQILRRELKERARTQKWLAEAMERPEQCISEIVNGKKQITPETALQLERVLDVSAELWLRLELAYRLGLARRDLYD